MLLETSGIILYFKSQDSEFSYFIWLLWKNKHEKFEKEEVDSFASWEWKNT